MSEKVSQFEATGAKFFHLLFLHYEYLLRHAFDKHLKYHYKTNAHRFKLSSFCINILFRNIYITLEPKQFLKISLRGVIG